MSLRLIIAFIISCSFLINCLKVKKNPFDASNNPVATIAIGGFPSSSSSGTSNSTTTTAPSNLTYSLTALQSKLIPGNSITITPDIKGTVDSWSISPDPPSWMTFDTKTGVITCNPPTGLSAESYTFTVTATNSGGKVSFNVPLQLLGSGDNVWTVINGIAGADTKAGTNSMKYDSSCKCLYIGGTTTGNLDGQTIPSTGGNQSGFLSRYDLDGNRIWTRVFGTSGAASTSVNGIANDSAGNIYLTGLAGIGNFNGINITVPNSWPNGAGYIIKYDSNGNLIWTTSSSPSILHYYSGILIDNNGDVIVSGTVVASAIDGMTNTGWSDQAGIVQKFNPTNGSRITGIIIPGNNPPSRGTDVSGVAVDSTGKIYLGVATRTTVSCGDGTTNWRPALFRYDANMGYLNCSPLAVTASTFAFGVTAAPNGDSYISGYGAGTIDSIALVGVSDAYFTKFDPVGTKQWTRRLGVAGANTAILSVIYESSINNLYITGITGGNLGGNTITGSRDMFIAKYDTSGNQVWLNMQGVKNDTLYVGIGGSGTTSIALDANKTLYSFGDTDGTIGGISNPAGSPKRSFFLVRNVQ